MAYVTKKVNTGNYHTFLCEGGAPEKETIIFIHGSGPGANSETNWRHILPAFSENYHVLALDLFGFGNTDHPEDPPQNHVAWMSAWVNQVIELMGYLKIDQGQLLVGNSLGGMISLNLTAEYPERVQKVVLMGSGGGAGKGPTPELTKLRSLWIDPTYRTKNITRSFVYDDAILGDNLDEILKNGLKISVVSKLKSLPQVGCLKATHLICKCHQQC